jgi:hypothetical protein
MLVKPETGRVATSRDSGRAPRGGPGRRASTDQSIAHVCDQRIRVSRTPEIGASGLMRAGAARKLAPPLLDRFGHVHVSWISLLFAFLCQRPSARHSPLILLKSNLA